MKHLKNPSFLNQTLTLFFQNLVFEVIFAILINALSKLLKCILLIKIE